MKKILFLTTLISLLGACTYNPPADDFVTKGRGIYGQTVSKKWFDGGPSEVQKEALEMANAQCGSMDKGVLIVNSLPSYQAPYYSHVVLFRCGSVEELAQANDQPNPESDAINISNYKFSKDQCSVCAPE